MNTRSRSREAHGAIDDIQPLGHVQAVIDGGKIRTRSPRAVEVVRRIERDARLMEKRAEARGPEVEIATGAMEHDDRGVLLSRLRRQFLRIKANGNLVDEDFEMSGHKG